MDDHHRHHHRHDPEGPDSAAAMAEMLDLDAEVLHTYLSDAVAWIRDLAADRGQHRILDLGSGTGTATVALARAFPQAAVVAIDSSTDFLGRVTAKAHDAGIADRVATLQADLDGPWPYLDPADVVWASMSLHHLADPDRVLTDVFSGIRPGGLLAVAEMDDTPRFLPDDIGVGPPGLEARCHAALAETKARELPHLGSDWGKRLTDAGFAPVVERTFAVSLTPPIPAPAGRYAHAWLGRMRSHLDGLIAAEDLATLDTLTDSEGPHNVLHRQDLVVRATRTIWAGTRP